MQWLARLAQRFKKWWCSVSGQTPPRHGWVWTKSQSLQRAAHNDWPSSVHYKGFCTGEWQGHGQLGRIFLIRISHILKRAILLFPLSRRSVPRPVWWSAGQKAKTSVHLASGLESYPRCVKRGCKNHRIRLLLFAHRPPRFRGVAQTLVQDSNAHTLRTEGHTLLAKGAIEAVPQANSESGFYSRYFLIPKRDSGLRPILDLRHLNHSLLKMSFKILTMKQILLQISPGDCFLSMELKDACFHIQISWDSRSKVWLISIQSYHSDCLWLHALLQSAYTQLFPLWARWESASWITSMTGCY